MAKPLEEIFKAAGYIPVSRDLFDDMTRTPTEEDLAAAKAGHQRRMAELEKALEAHADRLSAASEAGDQLSYRMLQLHAPERTFETFYTCRGCDFSGFDGEAPEWPCRTYAVLMEDL